MTAFEDKQGISKPLVTRNEYLMEEELKEVKKKNHSRGVIRLRRKHKKSHNRPILPAGISLFV
jgi:hypothetical protein